jgi:hypothetical protein
MKYISIEWASEWWMNTKIEFDTNQSLISKLEILLRMPRVG